VDSGTVSETRFMAVLLPNEAQKGRYATGNARPSNLLDRRVFHTVHHIDVCHCRFDFYLSEFLSGYLGRIHPLDSLRSTPSWQLLI
jgi:hypothetical protein